MNTEKFFTPLRIGAVLVVLVLLLVGGIYYALNFFQKELEEDGADTLNVSKITASGKLVIGTDATYPPMEFVDETGKLMGYDIDLGNRIAEELDVEAKFVNIPWDNLFEELVSGTVDIVISGVTITDERKQKYDFSDPYLNAGQVIITRKEETTIKSTADLTGKKIAVQQGTTNEEEALKHTSKELVLTYDDFLKATQALLAGNADALFSDLTNAKGIIDENPQLKIASDPFTSDFYGVVFRKGENDLVSKINGILDLLRQRGISVYLKQKWLE